MHVEVQEQVMGIGSFLPPCEIWGWNSGHQVWQQGYPLPVIHPTSPVSDIWI